MKYFEDEKKEIVVENLFSSIAEEMAKKFGEPYKKQIRRDKYKKIENSKSQIRKFYDEVLRYKLNAGLSSSEDENIEKRFRKMLPYIKMLKAKAVYALEREKITPIFKDFIWENVDNIKDYHDFKAFCEFFEAIVAFSAMYVKKD